MTGTRIAEHTADPAQVLRPASAPTASTVRFGLLLAAVLAAATGIFIVVHAAYLPGRTESLNSRVTRCVAALESDPGFTPSVERRDQLLAALARYRTCLRPAMGEMALSVTVGHGLLFGIAVVSYLAHPRWVVRRRRLKRLTATGSPALFAYLEQMRREMGLSRSPDWRIAPYNRTSGGQAFGTVWRRYVQLDAGLVVRFATDRPAFRAVVLHELAHLRNRDVDKTYLTIGIWRAFLVVAVLPYAVLMVHPSLFRAPLDWRWNESIVLVDPALSAYRIGLLLAVAGAVYLSRNSVLRVREAHADAVAAARDGPGSALPAVLARLPPTRRGWSRWGTHPDPASRLGTVRDPRLLLSAGPWELAGAGFATGIFAVNVTLMLGVVAGFDPTLGTAMVGLVAGAALAAMLAVSIWRSTAAAPERRPATRTWLVLPLSLTGGFVVGRFLSLTTVPKLLGEPTGALWMSWLVSNLLLAVGAVLVAAWLASATRGILTAPRPRRWAMPAVVAVAVLVGATAFVAWFPTSLQSPGFGLRGSDPPALGADIGWYAWLVAATGWQLRAAAYLVYLPLTLPALALLWLVPVVAGLRRPPADGPPGVWPDRVPLRRAVVPALVGGGCAVIIGAALPFLAKAALPVRARQYSDLTATGDSFAEVISGVTNTTGIVAVVIVLAFVVARGGRHRPALAAFAAMLTALLAAAGVNLVAVPMQCFANVFDLDPAPGRCWEPVDLALLTELVNTILVQGIVVAVPVVLVAAAANALVRRRWPPPAVPARPLTRHGFAVTVAAIALLTVVIGWLTWGILPDFAVTWLEPTFG